MSLSLNLDNFESDLAQETPYILTSPRSLRACSSLNVQPKELIYKSLKEYEDALGDLPLSVIYKIYEENETRRHGILLKCRAQRDLIRLSEMSKKDRCRSSAKSAQLMRTPAEERHFHSAPSKSKSKSHTNLHVNFDEIESASIQCRSGGSSRTLRDSRIRHKSQGQQSTTSDTESTEALNTCCLSTSRSVPDFTSWSRSGCNLDFRKYCQSPRNFELNDKAVLEGYLREYGELLEAPDLSQEDRKIMECLILKRGRELEWERRSQDMRKVIENERIRRWTMNQQLMQSWQDKLAEKRRFENLENTKRYLEIQEKLSTSRSNLMQYLDERDKRVQRYLEDMNYKKKKSLLERQRREALRQLEVGKAIEKLVEEDRQNREILKDKLQRRMEEADIRKRRRERDYYRHVSTMNRMEEIKRSLKIEQIEQKTRATVEELKSQIEEKEHRARMNYLARLSSRHRALSEGSGSRQQAQQKVLSIHSHLLQGLEEWHQRVLELQRSAQARAELKYTQELNRKRIRAASDRILREERSSEMLKRVQELESQRRDLLKTLIQSKEGKSARLKADKERKVQLSRLRAQHGAELRERLKSKIHPETFDRKAARAEMEMRLIRRGGGPPSICSAKHCHCNNNKGGQQQQGQRSAHSLSCGRRRGTAAGGGGGSATSHFGGPIKVH